MQWIQLAFFVMRMIIKYGPKLWKLGNEIYHDVEGKQNEDGSPLSSEQSANIYNQKATRKIVGKTGRAPDVRKLNALREDVWKKNNPGNVPKPLSNVRLRAMPRKRARGKARIG